MAIITERKRNLPTKIGQQATEQLKDFRGYIKLTEEEVCGKVGESWAGIASASTQQYS